jgi:uncharacterized protein (TIGR03437 family)
LKYAVTDSTGKTVLSGYSDYSVTNGGSISTTSLADGGYPFTGCWIAPGAADCDLSGSTAFTTYFSVLRNYPNNWKNIMWFFGNNLSLVNTGDATTTISLPGMLGVLLNGNRNDVLVTDGKQTLPFTPMFPDNPVFTDVPSLFIPWPASSAMPRITAVVDGASFDEWHPIATGGIVSIFGDNLGSSSAAAQSYPLPDTLAGTTVKVNGEFAPLYYASPGQINAQIPIDIIGNANLVVTTSQGTASSAISVSLISPQIFRGPNGEWFTDAFKPVWLNEVSGNGQWITIWAEGAGPTSPSVKEGMSAPMAPPFAEVTGDVTVLMCDDNLTPTFAGLAPGFAGLYQINVFAPAQCGGLLNPEPEIMVTPK